MDPTEALNQIGSEIRRYVTDPDWDPISLIEAVEALDNWMSNGGFKPAQWRNDQPKRGRPRRENDGLVLDGQHGKRSTYNKGCRCLECTAANREAGAAARARKKVS